MSAGFIEGSISGSESAKLPLQRVFEALARGNGEMQGQAEAKRVGTEQAESKNRMSVTLQPNPAGKVPLVTIKNAPADLLNQSQESDLEKAYLTPKANVERQLSGSQRNEERLRNFGFAPKTSDVAPEDVDSFGERYRARRELGGSIFGAAAMSALAGGRTDTRLVENLKNQRSAANSATSQKFVEPLLQSENRDIQTALEAGRLQKGFREEQRLATGQYMQARNQLLDQNNVIQFGSEDDFMRAATDGMTAVGGLRSDDEELFRRAYRTGRVSFLQDRIKALSGQEGQTAIQSYGNSPQEIERFVEEQSGRADLSDFERQRFRRTAKGLLDWKADQEQKMNDAAANQRRADDRIALAIASAGRQGADKPRKLTAFDTTHASVDALLSARGDEAFEQTSVEQAIRNRAGKLQTDYDKMDAEVKANEAASASIRERLKKRPNDKQLQRDLIAKQTRNKELVILLRKTVEQWDDLNGFIDQSEYDALINAGQTPESIAADGLRVRQ